MLTIQRASAGSGKTYALARTFITYYLTIPGKNGKRRLRSPNELLDSLNHILAVTFTNKATDEMKSRIIEKLNALALADPSAPDFKAPDYLKDIMELTDASDLEVIELARLAIRNLLIDFSSFNVSTIDSFFQSILRTFAYETDLNDSYQLELDDELTSAIGVDETLDKVLSGKRGSQTREWLTLLMELNMNDGGWNPFQRRQTSKGVYSTLIRNAKKMQSEEFKELRKDLEDFFDSDPDLYNSYRKLDSYFHTEISEEYAGLKKKAIEIKEAFKSNGLSLSEHGSKNLSSRISKALMLPNFKKMPFSFSKKEKVFKSNFTIPDKTTAEFLQNLYDEFFDISSTVKSKIENPQYKLWQAYRELLPYIPLLNDIAKNIREYLENTNTLQLSDTNTILARITQGTDTPFIYERLGTHINHYLIDEFQDTSLLQWRNFQPLLAESEAKGNENLIIGDAKQSIYRFRNADSSLITTVVPSTFVNHRSAGNSKAENTNWRSDRRIVQFNNLFFYKLCRIIEPDLSNLYSNVIQYPKKSADRGFVSYRFYKNEQGVTPEHVRNAGKIVHELLVRGYRQSEIAFLVMKNDEGQKVVQALMDYNRSIDEGREEGEHIEFISDQSLIIGSARSVKIIVGSLKAIAGGIMAHTGNTDGTHDKEGQENKINWKDISIYYSFYASRYPDKTPEEILTEIMNGDVNSQLMKELLSQMQSVALPSLVEKLTEVFVSEELKKTEAAFISAFQDAVLAYCENNPSDVASFISWWDKKADTLSINSPEDMDAVRIMTIHKSKGLEFECVIIPSANMDFKPSHKFLEWAWIKPQLNIPLQYQLPPYIPLQITPALKDTPHEPIYHRLCELVAMDSINKAYVAFTRAAKELYIYSPLSRFKSSENIEAFSAQGSSLGKYALEIFKDWDNIRQTLLSETDDPVEIPYESVDITIPAEQDKGTLPSVTFGKPLTPEEIADYHKQKDEKQKQENKWSMKKHIAAYHVNSDRGMLRYRESELPDTDSDDDDPRSEGNIRHEIMAGIRYASDLHLSVTKMVARGLIDSEEASEIESFLAKAIRSVEGRGWFDSSMRVLNERWTLMRGEKRLRPDRIVVDSEGNATIIDYKFGQHTDVSKYRTQMREYIYRISRTGSFSSVRAFIWYVSADKIEEIFLKLTDNDNNSKSCSSD